MKMMAEIRVWGKFPTEYLKYVVHNFHVEDGFNHSLDKEICYGAKFEVEFESSQYFKITNYLNMKKVKYEIYKGAKFTPRELDSVPYFIMIDDEVYVDSSKFNYSYSEVCSYCHFGRTLESKLQIPPSKLKKDRLTYIELFEQQTPIAIIPTKYIDLFKECSGITFESVLNSRTKEELGQFVQLKISNILNKANAKTNFVSNGEEGCSHCNIPRITLYDNLYYDQKTLDEALDFNMSYEWIGGGPFPPRRIIVSQKVRQIILKNKLLCKGCFRPILSVPPF